MKVRIPYSKSKRYLSGIDWVIGALDEMCVRATGGSNASQVVLELKGRFDDDRFRAAVAGFTSQFPVLGGRPARDWNLAPYWKMPPPGRPIPVKVEIRSVAEQDVMPALAQGINTRFAGAHEHLAFRVLHVDDDRHYLALHFDHRLFDAQGAEAFLDLFQRWSGGEDCRDRLARILPAEPAHLSDWMNKFEAGKQLVRQLLAFSKTTPVILPRPVPLKGRGFKFALIEFDARDSQSIIERAYKSAGFLMFMPYVLATALQTLDGVFRARHAKGQDYLITVSVDSRTPDTAASKMFFNHVSFLFFGVPAVILGDRKQVIEQVRSQMYEQIKSGFPRALAESSMLMRILPTSVLGRLMLRPLRGEFASLGLSCVGKGGYAHSQFMGAEVVNLFHMPLVPTPPGVGFFVNQNGDRMNVVLSYVDGMLDEDDVRRIRENVRRLL